MFGTVVKGPKNTRFRVEVKLDNGCTIYEVQIVANNELEKFEGLYGFTLDMVVHRLQKRIDQRAQAWAAQ